MVLSAYPNNRTLGLSSCYIFHASLSAHIRVVFVLYFSCLIKCIYFHQKKKCSILIYFNSFTTEKQTTKFLSANFQKMLSPSYIILRIKDKRANSVDLDEVVHCEPPHLDLCCLQIQLFLSLVLSLKFL